MLLNDVRDIEYDEFGDIIISTTNDMIGIDRVDALRQHINTRMKTFLNTCSLWQDLGNDIELMRGKRNIKENAQIIKEKIRKCLTFGDIFDIIDINMIPLSDDIILYYVSLSFDDGVSFNLKLNFDFENGIGWSI